MIRTVGSLLKALYATIGVFLFIAVIAHLTGALYTSRLEEIATTDFQAGIALDLNNLQNGATTLAHNESLATYLLGADTEPLLALIQETAATFAIGSIGVANSEGIIVSRSQKLGVQGDNVFLTYPEGRVVAKGKSVQTIGQSVINPSRLRMTVGIPINQGDRMIGAIFASNLTDNSYAVRFRDTYLSHGTEVVFYNKQFGVYGDSFSDPQTRKLVDSYFNSGSDWIQGGASDKTISFTDNSYYVVKNNIFPGLEQSSGGALLFIPRQDTTTVSKLAIALLTLFTFIFLALKNHLRTPGQERGWRYWIILSATALPIVVLSFLLLSAQNRAFLKLERIPYPLYNSTLRFQPESGIYSAGFEQRFTIVVDTGDEPINALQVGLLYDPAAITVKAIEVASSTCSYVIENKIDTKAGTAHLSCVVLNPTEARQSLSIADVVVKPLHNGTFALSFDNTETKVLADDGLGTNVLRMSQASSYKVDTFALIPQDSTASASGGRTFVVFSPTHQNQSRWYNLPVAQFVWRGRPDNIYTYALDTSPDTTPSDKHTTRDSEITLPIPGDGIYYFHLGLTSGGPVAHYRIQADRATPAISSIAASSEKIFAGDVVRFSFEAEDAASGIQQNYYIDLGNRLFLPIGSTLSVPFLDSGDQKITLRVYDNAGNYAEKSQIIHVEAR